MRSGALCGPPGRPHVRPIGLPYDRWRAVRSCPLRGGQRRQAHHELDRLPKNPDAQIRRGSAIPYDYRSIPAPDGVGRVLVHDDAEVAQRLIDGFEPLLALARDLNAREITTSKSPARRAIQKGEPTVDADGQPLATGEWRAATFRNLWTADTLLGRVVHHGDFIRDADGLPAEVWPPSLTRSEVDAIRRRLNWKPRPGSAATKRWHAPVPAAKPQRKRESRLLSGVAFCAECDGKMYVTRSLNARDPVDTQSPKLVLASLGLFVRLAGAMPCPEPPSDPAILP